MNDNTNWVTIENADNQAIAEMRQQELEAAGIPSILKPGDASSYMGASSPYEIQVPADQFDKAKEVLGD